MIVGIGTDLVDLRRMERLLKRNPRLVERILTEGERALLPQNPRRKLEFVGGRFALKEAFAKAMGTGIGAGLGWKDLSFLRQNKRPVICFHHARFDDPVWKKRRVHCSLSHEREYAFAMVIIEEES